MKLEIAVCWIEGERDNDDTEAPLPKIPKVYHRKMSSPARSVECSSQIPHHIKRYPEKTSRTEAPNTGKTSIFCSGGQ